MERVNLKPCTHIEWAEQGLLILHLLSYEVIYGVTRNSFGKYFQTGSFRGLRLGSTFSVAKEHVPKILLSEKFHGHKIV